MTYISKWNGIDFILFYLFNLYAAHTTRRSLGGIYEYMAEYIFCSPEYSPGACFLRLEEETGLPLTHDEEEERREMFQGFRLCQSLYLSCETIQCHSMKIPIMVPIRIPAAAFYGK